MRILGNTTIGGIVDYCLDLRGVPNYFETSPFATYRLGDKWAKRVSPGNICRYRIVDPDRTNGEVGYQSPDFKEGFLFVSQVFLGPYRSLPYERWERCESKASWDNQKKLEEFLIECYGLKNPIDDYTFTLMLIQKFQRKTK